MPPVLEIESRRLREQERLDGRKTAKQRNQWGQFATPPALSLDIAAYAWNLRSGGGRQFAFLDPAIGTGSFFAAILRAFPRDRIQRAVGIELDDAFVDAAKALWRREGLRVIRGDFTRQTPDRRYNLILTNPPYVRHHHLSTDDKARLAERAFEATGLRLNGLAGLYCYFLLIAHGWLADEGLASAASGDPARGLLKRWTRLRRWTS